MTADLLLQVIVCGSLVVVSVLAELAINQMGPRTTWRHRLSVHLIVGGSVAGVIWILAGAVPYWPSAIVAPGFALLLYEQRPCQRSGCPMRRKTDRARRASASRSINGDPTIPGIP